MRDWLETVGQVCEKAANMRNREALREALGIDA